MTQSRDDLLASLAEEVLRVYWGAQVDPQDALCVHLPVLDGSARVEVSVQGGVFTVRSSLRVEGHLEPDQVHQLNAAMPGASYCYVPDGSLVWLQSKFLVPDLDLSRVRPPMLGMAFSAGWRAAGGTGDQHYSGPSGYEHFVYLADFLAGIIHEQWQAQQGAAALALEEEGQQDQ